MVHSIVLRTAALARCYHLHLIVPAVVAVTREESVSIPIGLTDSLSRVFVNPSTITCDNDLHRI